MSQFPSCGAEPARLISARASCQEPHDPQHLGGPCPPARVSAWGHAPFEPSPPLVRASAERARGLRRLPAVPAVAGAVRPARGAPRPGRGLLAPVRVRRRMARPADPRVARGEGLHVPWLRSGDPAGPGAPRGLARGLDHGGRGRGGGPAALAPGVLAHPPGPLTATVRAAPPSWAYRASWRGMKTSRTSSSSATASGIAMRAPRTPSSAPPAITAITATAAGTDTARAMTRGEMT